MGPSQFHGLCAGAASLALRYGIASTTRVFRESHQVLETYGLRCPQGGRERMAACGPAVRSPMPNISTQDQQAPKPRRCALFGRALGGNQCARRHGDVAAADLPMFSR